MLMCARSAASTAWSNEWTSCCPTRSCSEEAMAGEPSSFFLVARIGASQRLIALSTIREIVPSMKLTVPQGVAGACCGIANVRGEVLPVFDVLERGGELDPAQMIVIAHGEHGRSI